MIPVEIKSVVLLAACLLLGRNDCACVETTTEASAGTIGSSVLVCEGATIAISPGVAVVISADSGKVKAELNGLIITATSLRLEWNGARYELQSGPGGRLTVTPAGTETAEGEGAVFQPSPSTATACFWPTKTAPAASGVAACYEPPPYQEQLMVFPLSPAPQVPAPQRTGRLMFGSSVNETSVESWVHVKGDKAWHCDQGVLVRLLSSSN